MSSVFELVYSLVELMTQPLLLVKLCYQFGIRSICIVIQTWIELLRSALFLPLAIFWKLIIWATALFSLPIRALTALYRERLRWRNYRTFRRILVPLDFTNVRTANLQLEMQLHRMKTELDYILWEREELEGRLNVATKERKAVEKMVKELEDENDDAIVKIELLEGEVHDLKEEMQRLKELQGKSVYDHKHEDDAVYNKTVNEGIGKPKHDLVKAVSKVSPPEHNTNKISKDGNILARQREVARSRSLFSAILSLAVGIIVWKAEDPCMPLVAALFSVVFMSLMSVVRFYSAIEHKPASEAVALLSFNWFVLGTLTYPTLPRVSLALSPLASVFLERTLKWLTT